ncbi:MAG: HAMP domain-containing sensor histidine kinase [Planctomycetota bacterium]|nr:HAMP domain-containing sensor histidine kinase [Planctomycetota bacterium]
MKVWRSWVFFGGCILVALLALTWVTSVVLGLEDTEREATQRAILEENTRLALWRVDSVMSAFIVSEGARPHFAYQSFYPAQLALSRDSKLYQQGTILVPSRLLGQSGEHVWLHFQSEGDGQLSSPQVPTGFMCDVAEQSNYAPSDSIEAYTKRLKQLGDFFKHDELLKKLGAGEAFFEKGSSYYELNLKPSPENQGQVVDQQSARYDTSNYTPVNQERRSKQELGARAFNNRWSQRQQKANKIQGNSIPKPDRERGQILAENERSSIEEGVMQAVWMGDHLLLARRVKMGEKVVIQGCWLDWKNLKSEFVKSLADLLPDVDLHKSTALSESSRRMASIPVELTAGPLPIDPGPTTSPRAVSLGIAWGACLIAALALGILLKGLLTLSERRGAFVSAVTHEMRTPLTTFRVYTEMLSEGMVPTEEKRTKYLKTLKREADRLGHLVNNVLAFSRLEGGRGETQREEMTLIDLFERSSRSLPDVADRVNVPLTLHKDGLPENQLIKVDASGVEQILVNLVDNACKYGKSEIDPQITLTMAVKNRELTLTVSDNGPGVLKSDRRRIFTPFFKSATEAAHSAPGVGLGLALSQRLAKQMGGRLEMSSKDGVGAAFTLSLPL